ncbi:MAG: hypothetical protein U0W40_11800 [Acidimicrobiia bacterium]
MLNSSPRVGRMLDGLFLGKAASWASWCSPVWCAIVGALFLLVLHLLQHVLWPTHWVARSDSPSWAGSASSSASSPATSAHRVMSN